MSPPAGRPREGRTRRAILERLKWMGPQDARRLARPLHLTSMAVRRHLWELAGHGLVTSIEEARPMGRPAKLWRLTAAAEDLFPDTHAELTVSLIDSVKRAFGQPGLDRLIAIRTAEQVESYLADLPTKAGIRERLEALAKARSREGYMAEVREDGDGSLQLIENHCPICVAARTCTGLCAGELSVFRQILGGKVTVERTDHILTGARRCAYRIVPAGRAAGVGTP